MKVLIACEFSGTVRDAFINRGHNAWSCDLLPTESKEARYHLQCDIFEAIEQNDWDLMIAHPPCTYLANSGARWFKGNSDRIQKRNEAVEFVRRLFNCGIPKIAIENPIGSLPRLWRNYEQIIHPWQFGHGETKATCLWLKGLPKLQPTNIVDGREGRIHKLPPSPNRWKFRSITYQGISDAMAEQWGAEHPTTKEIKHD